MDEQQLQQQIIQLVQAAMQGDQQANQQIQQIMQAAQQGDQQAVQIAQMIQAVVQQMQQQQVQAAKFGAKLNYVRQLRGLCPEGQELEYYRDGGRLCKRCIQKQKMQNGGETPSNLIDAFKCDRKMRKKACGGSVEKDKCGNKIKKAKGGTKTPEKKYTSKKTKGEEVLAGSPTSWYNKPAETLEDASGNRYMTRIIPNPGDTVYIEPNWVDKKDPRYSIYRNEFDKYWKDPKKTSKKK